MTSEDMRPRPKKVSKSEKIIELETELKLAAEENRRLRSKLVESQNGELQRMGRSKLTASEVDFERMKDAMKAIKSVTLTQEKTISSLRTKATQRRVDVEQKDTIIRFLRREIDNFRWVEEQLESVGNGDDPKETLRALQKAFLEERNANSELLGRLDESEVEVCRLREELEFSTASGRDFGSLCSHGSISDCTEFEHPRVREEMARQTNTIKNLERELDMIKEELYEERATKKQVRFSASTHERSYGSSTASETSDEYGDPPPVYERGRRDDYGPDSFDLDFDDENDDPYEDVDNSSWY